MAELLSMTLLSAEPVSAAKPQVGLSADGASEPDQSFAATLAAEVNGKTPETSGKTSVKVRQNTASDASESKESLLSQQTASAETKSQLVQPAVNESSALSESTLSDEEQLLATETDAQSALLPEEEVQQSPWLYLLEKAKKLHERLDKHHNSKTDLTLNPAPLVDKTGPGLGDEGVELTVTAAQHQADHKTTELLAAKTATSAQLKNDNKAEAAVTLDEALLAGQSADKPLTDEELTTLKQALAADKTLMQKQVNSDGVVKQNALVQKAVKESELVVSEKVDAAGEADRLLTSRAESMNAKVVLSSNNEAAAEQLKSAVQLDKAVKIAPQTLMQSSQPEKAPQSEGEFVGLEGGSSSPEDLPESHLVFAKSATTQFTGNDSKTELAASAAKQTSAEAKTLLQSAAAGTELSVPSDATEGKVSVNAQTAAALVAPLANQAKTGDTKVTTEEVLKQAQTAALSAQADQGSSSSSGGSAHQGTAETLLAVVEQPKTAAVLATDINSFSSQLKSSIEKTSAGITVAARDSVSEQVQKQVDQLGQKLNLIQPEASSQLKDRMLMMVKDKVHTAEIRLDPSELGSMQIKISMQQDQMSVQFMVQQGNAKELMEQQMPKLKELLQQQGIELSQGSVQQQNQSSAGQGGGRRTASGQAGNADGIEDLVEPALLPTKNTDRVVDYYA